MTDIDLQNPSAIIQAIEQNLFDQYDAICLLSHIANYEKKPHWMRLFTGIHHPICNSIMNPKLDMDRIDDKIRDAMAPFGKQIPMLWYIGPSAQLADITTRLTNHGLVKAGSAAGMAVNLAVIHEAAIPEGLVIRSAVMPKELDDWGMVFSTVFELPPEACAFFNEPFALMVKQQNDRSLQLIGYIGGKPVACGTFFISAGVGGIYNIGTLQEARGKGIGLAITSAGMAWLRRAGLNVAILQSSSMGIKVYERLGFQHFCDFHLFTNITENK